MLLVTIKKKSNSEYLDHGNFQSEIEAMVWFQPFIDKGIYGKKEHSYEQLVSEEIPAVLDEEGNELSPAIPAVYETIHVPAEYEIEITDIPAQIEKEVQEQARKQLGALIDHKCKEAIKSITGYNASNDFSFEQIDQLELEFGDIFSALSKNRIDKAVVLLSQVQPDGVLLTQEFIDSLLAELSL